MKSWDVFDTLIARRVNDQNKIFETIAPNTKAPIEQFVQYRRDADNGARTLLEIYQELERLAIIGPGSAANMVRFEVALEENNIFPIKENMDQVEDGDLLVSDMYIAGPNILRLVRAAGLTKQVTIYQSNGDKSSGKFWSDARNNLMDIDLHTGDNPRSDVEAPKNYDFKSAYHTQAHASTASEEHLKQAKLPALSRLVREIRLRNHMPEQAVFFEGANQYNLPWLFIACELMDRYVGKSNNLTFLGRDCQLLHKIYKEYYDANSYYLPFSRSVVKNNPKYALEYLRTQKAKDSMLIDISSTGRTWEALNYDEDITVLFYSDKFFYSEKQPVLPRGFKFFFKNSASIQTNTMLEVFNCADHGRLDKVKMYGNVPLTTFLPHDLDANVVKAIHKPINDAVALSKHYEDILTELFSLEDEDLYKLFLDYANNICTAQIDNPELQAYRARDDQYTKECKA